MGLLFMYLVIVYFSVIHLFIRFLFSLTFSFLSHYFYCCFLFTFTIKSEHLPNELCSDNIKFERLGSQYAFYIIRYINFVSRFILAICSTPMFIPDLIYKKIFNKFF